MAAVEVAELDETLDAVRDRIGDVDGLVGHLRAMMRREVADVLSDRERGRPAVPEVLFDDVASGAVGDDRRAEIRRRGCVLVRGTFPVDEARRWDQELGDYLTTNHYLEQYAEREPERAASGVRIYGIYWSRPQIAVRQHERMGVVQSFLETFWAHESHGRRWFEQGRDAGYPDRIRRRAPGERSVGLGPHVDSDSGGGWRVAENHDVYRHVIEGNPEAFDPWDAAFRTSVPVAGVGVAATVFRPFQGWTALTDMHPSDGGLQLLPIPSAMAYGFVRGIADDLAARDAGEELRARRRIAVDDDLLPAMSAIPTVAPGDTIWWHGDLVHGVAEAANDTRWGNVIYVPSAPMCERNAAYAATVYERFVRGASPADFPPEDYEVNYLGRATVDDLNETGRRQMGLE
jgi:hypothetical protein